MKKFSSLFSLLLILLISSCSSSFQNVRQHAHRNYVKIGPGAQHQENAIEPANNKVELINTTLQVQTPSIKIDGDMIVVNAVNNKINRKKSFFKTAIDSVKKPCPQKTKSLRKSVKKSKDTNSTAVLNVLSFIFGIIAVVLGFITGIMFIMTLLFPASVATCIAMAIVVCSIGLLAIILGVLGLSLGFPKRGLGIAGVIMAGVGILISLLAVIFFFVFL